MKKAQLNRESLYQAEKAKYWTLFFSNHVIVIDLQLLDGSTASGENKQVSQWIDVVLTTTRIWKYQGRQSLFIASANFLQGKQLFLLILLSTCFLTEIF